MVREGLFDKTKEYGTWISGVRVPQVEGTVHAKVLWQQRLGRLEEEEEQGQCGCRGARREVSVSRWQKGGHIQCHGPQKWI